MGDKIRIGQIADLFTTKAEIIIVSNGIRVYQNSAIKLANNALLHNFEILNIRALKQHLIEITI